MNFPKTVEAIMAMAEKWPQAHRKLVEDKANGPAVISMLQTEISGLIAVNPEGGKISRAHAVSAVVEAGNVFLPASNDRAMGGWVPRGTQYFPERPP
jgi:predicted phage terminase large subunit-like protein